MMELFPGFLENPLLYEASRQYWADLFWHEVECYDRAGEWSAPWFADTYADGTSHFDGNPIFSAVCKVRRLGLRVIQFGGDEVTSDDQLDFGWWLDTFDGEGPEPIRELVVSCSLCPENVTRAKELIYHWIRGRRLEEERSGYITDPEVGEPGG